MPTGINLFRRFFVSFEAQKLGFLNGCRPFIGVDGCHLKGPYEGVLLSVVCLDANNDIFPLAVAICEGENADSWGWFLNALHHFMGPLDDRPITFMLDRQKGLKNVIDNNYNYIL